MVTAQLHHEVAGRGQPLLFLHPGFADSRIWDPQWPTYAKQFQLIRCDMRGFGRSQVRSLPVTYASDVAALLDELEIRNAAIVGCSLGGRAALELAVARPDLVRALVLVGTVTPEALAMAPEMAEYATELTAAIRRQDLDAAVEVNLRYWVDGPHRAPTQVDPALRARIATMQRDAFLNTKDFAARWREEPLVTDLSEKLAGITVPTLVLVGELDMEFIHDQARLLARTIVGAQLQTLGHTGHAPSAERPASFDELVLPFLVTT